MKKALFVAGLALLLVACTVKKTTVSDAKKIKEEYESYNGKIREKTGLENRTVSIDEDNPFVYITSDELIKKIDAMGYSHLPICVAKTQYSFTDDPKRLGAPVNFEMTVNEVRLAAGAGFVVMICGKIMTMPGLPKTPAANNINVDDNGQITGLF